MRVLLVAAVGANAALLQPVALLGSEALELVLSRLAMCGFLALVAPRTVVPRILTRALGGVRLGLGGPCFAGFLDRPGLKFRHAAVQCTLARDFETGTGVPGGLHQPPEPFRGYLYPRPGPGVPPPRISR